MVEKLVTVLKDSPGYQGVVWDRMNSRWDTGRRAMLNHDPDSRWHMVVQDDAVLPLDFAAGVEAAMQRVGRDSPNSPSALYIGHVRRFIGPVNNSMKGMQNPSWIRMPGLNWGVAIIVPTEQISQMIHYCDKLRKIKNYDLRLSQWFERNRWQVWYPWPQLIDHDPGPSMVRGRGGNRHTMKFIGKDVSALDFDPYGQVANVNITRPVVPPRTSNTVQARRQMMGVTRDT